MEKITLSLTLDEANLLLKALGEMPFREVFELIGKIQQQANQQLQDTNPGRGEPPLNAGL